MRGREGEGEGRRGGERTPDSSPPQRGRERAAWLASSGQSAQFLELRILQIFCLQREFRQVVLFDRLLFHFCGPLFSRIASVLLGRFTTWNFDFFLYDRLPPVKFRLQRKRDNEIFSNARGILR